MLTVEDDGNGMTLNRFKTAFLRIAGRDKEQGFRRSPRYSRAYTGQKGIGRLASQKLANVLHVRSIPNSVVAAQEDLGVYACIDWKVIDQQDTSNELEQGLTVEPLPAAISASAGTVLSMSSLKRQWTCLEISRFVHEVRSAQPPPFIMSGDARSLGLVDEPLFGVPFARLSSVNDPGFSIAFMGEFEQGDDYWEQARLNFRWCVEVDVEGGRARVQITPTVSEVSDNRFARTYRFEKRTSDQLRFQARFFVYPGASANRGPLQGFVRGERGIRVYLEGFRVLPYGDGSDDWLSIDRDYRSGSRYYSIDVDDELSDYVDLDKREGLHALGQNSYFGAVFLTEAGAPSLESLINREGFVPGDTFKEICNIVQTAVRLSVRVHHRQHPHLQRHHQRGLQC